MNTPSLFDLEDAPERTSDWLIPQRVFNSWHPSRQSAFMAARDRDSAQTAADRGEDPEFYTRRAQMYE